MQIQRVALKKKKKRKEKIITKRCFTPEKREFVKNEKMAKISKNSNESQVKKLVFKTNVFL